MTNVNQIAAICPKTGPATCAPVVSRTIGFSVQGKPLEVQHWGSATAGLRVLFVCGQHGDERGIRRALGDFLRKDLPVLLAEEPDVQVCILADANPDGAAARSRLNAQGIDINRDHLMLEAPETRAIHRFVQSWQPQLVVDMHNFPSRREHLTTKGLRLGWDVCMDYPSNPATGFGKGHPVIDNLMDALKLDLGLNGYRFGRYSILKADGSARHSTPHLVDARNVLTLRHGAVTLLLEARNPGTNESRTERRHVRRAVAHACSGILRWCRQHWEALGQLGRDLPANDRIPLRHRRRVDDAGLEVPVAAVDNSEESALHFPTYRPHTQGRRRIEPPFGYAVPLAEHGLLQVLARHGFHSFLAGRGERFAVSESIYGFRKASNQEGTSKLPGVSRLRYDRSLEGFVVFPYAQAGGRLLALMLEATSVYALHRRLPSANEIQPGTICPVRRVVAPCSPTGCDSIFEVAS
jgi:hypothetical protein